MALTQSARLPPSWDEEVVPALRKRLESESRTLARRMSAVSLSSLDESPSADFPTRSNSTIREPPTANPMYTKGNIDGPRRTGFQQSGSSDRSIPSSSARVNGASPPLTKPVGTSFQRSRTYSQPYLSDLPNGNTNGAARARTKGVTKAKVDAASTHRPPDIKPTRIPKASRGQTGSTSSHGHATTVNGHHYMYPNPNPSLDLQTPHETLSATSSRSNFSVPSRQNSGILNQQPPFKPGSMSSNLSSREDETPPRPSNESEEHPFEHLYRGEVSRNGGVGELRIGRRQEMLDIANYGHTIRSKAPPNRNPMPNLVDDGRLRRKRADSVSEICSKERDTERESLYLDEEHVRDIGRVLDEGPPTDLDGEGDGSDLGSASEYHTMRRHDYHHMPGEGDISTASAPAPQTTYETHSSTPTPRLSERQQHGPPTRIPGPSSRRSSESRVPTPTSMSRGSSEPPSLPSSSPSASPPSQRQRQQSKPTPVGTKRRASPASTSASKKSRTAASKATRAKTMATRKEMEEEANRRSVAYYPTPVDGNDTMEDAIPSWTQPVPREGNWDDVVLPVVARKKGLDGHYEQADGSPQPKKVNTTIAPAPGTFGFDHSKYRPPRGDAEPILADEFGIPTDRIVEEPEPDKSQSHASQYTPTPHEATHLPVHRAPPPLTTPFSHYALAEKDMVPVVTSGSPSGAIQRTPDEDEKGAGCCKCVIM